MQKNYVGVYLVYFLFLHRKREHSTTTAPVAEPVMTKAEEKPTQSMRLPITDVSKALASVPAKK